MFQSLGARILFFITLIMVVTAALILYFTERDVGRAMLKAQNVSVQNDFHFVSLNIEQAYGELLTQKVNMIAQRKKQLKVVSDLALSVLNNYWQFAHDGTLSSLKAQTQALSWLRNTTFDKGVYWFIFNSDARIISSSIQRMEQTDISSLKDIKGRNLSLMYCQESRSALPEFGVFDWNSTDGGTSGQKLGYFSPFPKWGWTLVSVIDISDVQAEMQQIKAQSIQSLKKSFSRIRVARTGSVFLFDSKKQILIPPAAPFDSTFWMSVNPATGKPLLSDLMTTARSPGQTLKLGFPVGKADGQKLEVHVSYFKSFNWYAAIIIPLQEMALPAHALIAHQSLIIALLFLFSLAIMYFLVSRISQPLHRLGLAAKELPALDFTIDEDIFTPIDSLAEKRKDEVGRLAESFVFMKSELKSKVRNLMETTATKERIQGELNTARQIQLGILPKSFPPFPDHHEFDLYATLTPAKEVGGDLYDFFFIDDNHLCFALGDVSDKGVPAALFMVITRTLVKTSAQKSLSPALMMERINDILGADNPNTMFVTLIVGILDIKNGEIRYANGGHNPPVLMSENDVIFLPDISGPVVGAFPGLAYKELHLQLGRGDTLFLYTDGVTEAMDENGAIFSNEALLASLATGKSMSVETIIESVTGEIEKHVGDTPQSDDIAMMTLRYRGQSTTN